MPLCPWRLHARRRHLAVGYDWQKYLECDSSASAVCDLSHAHAGGDRRHSGFRSGPARKLLRLQLVRDSGTRRLFWPGASCKLATTSDDVVFLPLRRPSANRKHDQASRTCLLEKERPQRRRSTLPRDGNLAGPHAGDTLNRRQPADPKPASSALVARFQPRAV